MGMSSINAQFNVSGSVKPTSLYRTSDHSHISLPFRLAEIKLGYAAGSIDLITHGAVEYRWRGEKAKGDLREMYLVWYPEWGEVKLGKQIHAWGAADGNNPTDILNADDYYFMFLPGADRKRGSISGSVKIYKDTWQGEVIVVPDHQGNRLPFGEEDFPFTPPFEPENYQPIDSPVEFGIRLQTTWKESDVSLSFFKGHDRGFNIIGFNVPLSVGIRSHPSLVFGYRKTSMFGMDCVTFLGDFTVRVEGAYFQTENEDNNLDFGLRQSAGYSQYVIQLEYPGPYDISLSGQLIGNTIHSVEGKVMDVSTQQLRDLSQDTFNPGMGTPFASFSELAFLGSASAVLMDDRIDIKINGMVNLEEKGSMTGMTLSYSPWASWKGELGITLFKGDAQNPNNAFTQMEDFSHLSLKIQYNI